MEKRGGHERRDGKKIEVWNRHRNEAERAGDSFGDDEVRVPGDEQVDNSVNAGDRVGCPRRFYDSEIRGDGKHGFSDSDFLPQRNTGQLG